MSIRRIIYIGVFLAFSSLHANETPDEQFIYKHLHQAQGWAELLKDPSCPQSQGAIEQHLGKVKYNQMRLVDSVFYKDYLRLRDMAFFSKREPASALEGARLAMHQKAEKLNLNHDDNWLAEFIGCQSPGE